MFPPFFVCVCFSQYGRVGALHFKIIDFFWGLETEVSSGFWLIKIKNKKHTLMPIRMLFQFFLRLSIQCIVAHGCLFIWL